MTLVAKSHDQAILHDGRGNHCARAQYVVGSERQQIFIAADRDGIDDGRPVPDGIRHAVDSTTSRVKCGVSSDSLFVFDDLDWKTMLSNEMCPQCKRTAF